MLKIMLLLIFLIIWIFASFRDIFGHRHFFHFAPYGFN